MPSLTLLLLALGACSPPASEDADDPVGDEMPADSASPDDTSEPPGDSDAPTDTGEGSQDTGKQPDETGDPADDTGEPADDTPDCEGREVGIIEDLCAPDFTLPDQHGEDVSLYDHASAVILVEFAAFT